MVLARIMILVVNLYNDINQCYGVSLGNLLTHIMVLARTVVLAYIMVFACVMVLAVNPYHSVSLSLGINC